MKIMIPMSGGVDSAALLQMALATDAEVIAVHVAEDVSYGKERAQQRAEIEQQHFETITDHLREHHRAFKRQVVPPVLTDPAGRPFDLETTEPLRRGFSAERPMGWKRVHWASHGCYAEKFQPDVVWIGMDALNTKSGWYEPGGCDERAQADYHAYTDIPFELPFFRAAGERPPVDRVMGRCEITGCLSRDLYALSSSRLCAVRLSAEDGCGACWRCRVRDFYDRHCPGRPPWELAAIDDRWARLGAFGRYAHLADPETYTLNVAYDALEDPRWPDWLDDVLPTLAPDRTAAA